MPVEVLCERLEVDVGRVHVPVELRSWGFTHVAGRDGDGFDAEFVARIGGVDGVLEEDDRIVVGESDALHTQFGCGRGDLARRGHLAEPCDLLGLRDVPVLAEATREVAAGGAEREHGAAGQEVVERLLLDRVDAVATRAAVCRQHHLIAGPASHETHPALTVPQLARSRAHVALDAAVVELVPILRRHRVDVVQGELGSHRFAQGREPSGACTACARDCPDETNASGSVRPRRGGLWREGSHEGSRH